VNYLVPVDAKPESVGRVRWETMPLDEVLSVVDGAEHLICYGDRYLSRQASALGGGTTEIARNIIGERVLGFPREYAADRGVPFNQVAIRPGSNGLPDATLRRRRRLSS